MFIQKKLWAYPSHRLISLKKRNSNDQDLTNFRWPSIVVSYCLIFLVSEMYTAVTIK